MRALCGAIIAAGAAIGLGLTSLAIGTRYHTPQLERDTNRDPVVLHLYTHGLGPFPGGGHTGRRRWVESLPRVLPAPATAVRRDHDDHDAERGGNRLWCLTTSQAMLRSGLVAPGDARPRHAWSPSHSISRHAPVFIPSGDPARVMYCSG